MELIQTQKLLFGLYVNQLIVLMLSQLFLVSKRVSDHQSLYLSLAVKYLYYLVEQDTIEGVSRINIYIFKFSP